jgi:predicted nucleotidyltransferase component of viral defense system
MSLFDKLVNEALQNQPNLAALRMVVEKDLLHHDVLRILSREGLLTYLTFIGGTCLRACYGSNRLSEDLDFTGGADFTRENLSTMGQVLVDSLETKYGLQVVVSEPVREIGNVDTWKLKIQTRPNQRDQPAQRINVDVCSIPSYQVQPRMLLNPYGVEMGTSGLILQVESREEIFVDKMVAFALRPNRMEHRDLWDMTWLHQQGIKPAFELVPMKLRDHRRLPQEFLAALDGRLASLRRDPKLEVEFHQEMRRFLPLETIQRLDQKVFWEFLVLLMDDLCQQTHKAF